MTDSNLPPSTGRALDERALQAAIDASAFTPELGMDDWHLPRKAMIRAITAYLSAPLPAANPDYTATWRDTQ